MAFLSPQRFKPLLVLAPQKHIKATTTLTQFQVERLRWSIVLVGHCKLQSLLRSCTRTSREHPLLGHWLLIWEMLCCLAISLQCKEWFSGVHLQKLLRGYRSLFPWAQAASAQLLGLGAQCFFDRRSLEHCRSVTAARLKQGCWILDDSGWYKYPVFSWVFGCQMATCGLAPRLQKYILGVQIVLQQKDQIGFDPMASTAFLAGERLKAFARVEAVEKHWICSYLLMLQVAAWRQCVCCRAFLVMVSLDSERGSTMNWRVSLHICLHTMCILAQKPAHQKFQDRRLHYPNVSWKSRMTVTVCLYAFHFVVGTVVFVPTGSYSFKIWHVQPSKTISKCLRVCAEVGKKHLFFPKPDSRTMKI